MSVTHCGIENKMRKETRHGLLEHRVAVLESSHQRSDGDRFWSLGVIGKGQCGGCRRTETPRDFILT